MSSPPPRPPDRAQHILIIDDDAELCALIHDYLEPLGYTVEAVHDGSHGLERALAEEFGAVILDVMLPGLDGFEVLRRLRTETETPVLMLTARGEETDRVVGLEMGADDYLPKTFSPRELLARLRAVTRRTARPPAPPEPTGDPAELHIGPLRISLDRREASLEGQPLRLTSLEFELLAALARARGRVKSREQLIEAIADRQYDGMDRSIDVHIWSLRRKLGDDSKAPRFIRTIRSAGYMLIQPGSE
jgi:two-component system response regulator CpxR